MKKSLEEELESAATAGDEQPVVKAIPIAVHSHGKGEQKSLFGAGLLVILLAMAGGVVALVLSGVGQAQMYSMPADQLLSRADELRGRKVRVEGELVPGTLEKQDSPCMYRFTMQAKGQRMPVSYSQCTIPDTFRDQPEGGVMVTVEGSLPQSGTFDASLVMAKCSSKYDPKTHEIIKPDGSRVKAGPSAGVDDFGG